VREKLRLAEYASARYHEAVAALPRLSSDGPEEARLRQLHSLCFQWFMPNLQERALRMSPIPVITPYCDDRLVQYVYNVPWALKNTGGVEKGLLRQAMRDLLPESLAMRRKSPFPKTRHPLYTALVREARWECSRTPPRRFSRWSAPTRCENSPRATSPPPPPPGSAN
jgi:asparagine synthase (glutamine-hydrolysing)